MTTYEEDLEIEENELDKLDAVKKGIYKASLVLSLGGIGSRILRQLKRRLDARDKHAVKLLAIDSDSSENEKWPELPQLSKEELVLMNPAVALNNLAQAVQGGTKYKSVLEYLPDAHGNDRGLHGYVKTRIGTGKGAGQFRRAGKLLFRSNVSSGANLAARLDKIKQELLGLSKLLKKTHEDLKPEPGINIYVVCSIAGGTGAGCLIDTLALLRKVFDSEQTQIVTFGLLPGTALDRVLTHKNELVNTRANAIGVLSEIQAIKSGAVLPMDFEFDPNTKYSAKGGANFPNTFYLVDNQMLNGTVVDDMMDVCKAVGTFVYCLVGTGMGAAKESSVVNNGEVNPGQHAAGEIPCMFSALGLGYLEFPSHDILRYAFRLHFDGWLAKWIVSSVEPDAGRQLAQNTKSQLRIGDLSELNSSLGLSVEFIPELSGFSRPERERLTKFSCFDKDFFKATERKTDSFSEDLPECARKIEGKAKKALANAIKVLQETFSECYGKNLGAAIQWLEVLSEQLTKIQKELSAEPRRLASLKKDIESRKESYAKSINRKDLISDTADRNLYMNVLREDMEYLLVNACHPTRIAFIGELDKWVSDKLKTLETLNKLIAAKRITIAKYIKETNGLPYKPGIATFTVLPTEFAKWSEGLELPADIGLTGEDVDYHVIYRKALTAAKPALLARRDAVNLTKDLVSDKALQAKLAGVKFAANPLMSFYEGAVNVADELNPATFIAGDFPGETAANNAFADKYFADLNFLSDKRSIIHTGNKQLLVCSQVFSVFGAAHWSGFEDSESRFKSTPDKPWYCSTFPAAILEKVPPLKPLNADEKTTLVNFGLGLALDLIDKRGSNYYINFEFTDEKKYRYISYKKSRGQPATALVENAVIDEARSTKLKPGKLVGDSLTAAIATMRENPDFKSGTISELFENVARAVGFPAAKQMLTDWIGTDFAKEISKASGRREVLEDIADKLTEYANNL